KLARTCGVYPTDISVKAVAQCSVDMAEAVACQRSSESMSSAFAEMFTVLIAGVQMAITVQMPTEISGLYVALFGRAPDTEGFDFWIGRLGQGDTLAQVAEAMFATDSARQVYPDHMANGDIISSF